MKTSNNFNNWVKNKPKSYVNTFAREKLLTLDLGECSFGKKQKNEIFTNSVDINQYPHSQNKLKNLLARKFSLTQQMITLGNGSDEIIEHIPQAFINPGDSVLVVVPTFFRFIDSSMKRQAKIHFVATRKEDKFVVTEHTVQEILKVAKKNKVKLIWLCSPNNPTGIPIKHSLIEKIVEGTKALVILDQVYAELQMASPKKTHSLVKRFKNIIILKSFSKVFGLAGIRVGFSLSSPTIAAVLEQWKLPFNISSLSIEIAEKTLQDKGLAITIKNSVKHERQLLFKEIKHLKNFELIDTSETNIFLLRHTEKNLFEELLKRDILIADLRTAKGLEGMNFTRITIGERKNNNLFLQALKDIN